VIRHAKQIKCVKKQEMLMNAYFHNVNMQV
jgi:hypothetical protein